MNTDQGDIRCQIAWQLDQDKKYDEVVEHVLTGCLNCITNPRKRFNGREMLFPNGPPPWITIPEAEKSNPDNWKKFHKKQVRSEMTADEFEKFLVDSELSDAQMCWEIAKFKRVEKIEAWSMVREIRRKQKEKRQEQERQERDARRLQSEAKREAEKVKKLDEKRKILEKKQQKDDEKSEYLEKIKEDEKLLVEEDGEEEEDQETVAKRAKTNPNPNFPEKIPERKEFNLRWNMPWAPSTYDLLCAEQRSKLGHEQQKRIIAMCQSLLYHGELRHQGNRHELKDIRKVTEDEYDALVAAALEHARNEACHPLDFTTEKAMNYCMYQFKKREVYPEADTFLIKSPSFTVENVEIVSGIRSEAQGIVPKMEKMLRMPLWTSRLTLPDISKKCEVKQNFRYPPERRKTRLLDDSMAYRLLSNCPQVTVVADATTISHILTPNWESRDYEFGVPIRVKTQRIDGVDTKCVVLSKPMPSNTVSKATIQRKALKRALKNQFVTKSELQKRYQKAPPPPTTSSHNSSESQISESSSRNSESADAPSFLDSILDQMQSTDQKFSSSNHPAETTDVPENPEDLSYQYAIFRIGDARVLIRSGGAYLFEEHGEKKHSLLEPNFRITFEPRIEYLPNGGAMQMGPEEWVWNYTKAVFKGSNSHVLYRTNYRLDHVLQLDALSMRIDKQEPPPDALGLLSARCMMLERMIAQLEELEEGDFMLVQEKDRPMIVVPKCEHPKSDGVSIGAMRIKKVDCQKTTSAYEDDDYFHGFCRDVPLQWQIVQGRAPQMLLAEDSPTLNVMPSKGNRDKLQREKWNVKRKLQQKEARRDAAAKRKRAVNWDDPNLYADFTNPAVNPVDYDFDKELGPASSTSTPTGSKPIGHQHHHHPNNKRGGASSRGGANRGGNGGFRGGKRGGRDHQGKFQRGGGARGRGRGGGSQRGKGHLGADGSAPSTSGARGGEDIVEIP